MAFIISGDYHQHVLEMVLVAEWLSELSVSLAWPLWQDTQWLFTVKQQDLSCVGLKVLPLFWRLGECLKVFVYRNGRGGGEPKKVEKLEAPGEYIHLFTDISHNGI